MGWCSYFGPKPRPRLRKKNKRRPQRTTQSKPWLGIVATCGFWLGLKRWSRTSHARLQRDRGGAKRGVRHIEAVPTADNPHINHGRRLPFRVHLSTLHLVAYARLSYGHDAQVRFGPSPAPQRRSFFKDALFCFRLPTNVTAPAPAGSKLCVCLSLHIRVRPQAPHKMTTMQ